MRFLKNSIQTPSKVVNVHLTFFRLFTDKLPLIFIKVEKKPGAMSIHFKTLTNITIKHNLSFLLTKLWLVFPTRVFYDPKPVFFSTTKPGYYKKPGIAVAFKYE